MSGDKSISSIFYSDMRARCCLNQPSRNMASPWKKKLMLTFSSFLHHRSPFSSPRTRRCVPHLSPLSYLWLTNPQVVLAVVRVFYYTGPPSSASQIVKPLLRIMHVSREVERVVLAYLLIITRAHPVSIHIRHWDITHNCSIAIVLDAISAILSAYRRSFAGEKRQNQSNTEPLRRG